MFLEKLCALLSAIVSFLIHRQGGHQSLKVSNSTHKDFKTKCTTEFEITEFFNLIFDGFNVGIL